MGILELKGVIGFVFVIFGLVWSIFERNLCGLVCKTCNAQQISPCVFLFLFVGIIFLISGTILVLTRKNK